MIGHCHEPTSDEKKQAHSVVEEFATSRLPAAFAYVSSAKKDVYELWTQKLLPKTWQVLGDLGLAGAQYPGYRPVSRPTGLTVMSILADCCAGETKARITDERAAYAQLSGLLTEDPNSTEPQLATDRLLPITLRIANMSGVSIERLIEFREREQTSSHGFQLRALRHNYLDALAVHAKRLANAKTHEDCVELERQFTEQMRHDVQELRNELRLSAMEVVGEKELIAAIVVGATALLALPMGMPVPEVVTVTGGIASVGGVLAAAGKFTKSRRDILQTHPMSYLYESSGTIWF